MQTFNRYFNNETTAREFYNSLVGNAYYIPIEPRLVQAEGPGGIDQEVWKVSYKVFDNT